MKKIEVGQQLGGGVRAILDDREWSPVVKRMAELSGGVTTEEEIEKMMKEDPRVRYILTKKYE
jgi:hypothetical protein